MRWSQHCKKKTPYNFEAIGRDDGETAKEEAIWRPWLRRSYTPSQPDIDWSSNIVSLVSSSPQMNPRGHSKLVEPSTWNRVLSKWPAAHRPTLQFRERVHNTQQLTFSRRFTRVVVDPAMVWNETIVKVLSATLSRYFFFFFFFCPSSSSSLLTAPSSDSRVLSQQFWIIAARLTTAANLEKGLKESKYLKQTLS